MWQKTTRVAIIDTETTGLGPLDEPISVGILLLEVESIKGTLVSEIGCYYGRRFPAVQIHPRAQIVHGISRGDLVGLDIDIERVSSFLDQAEVFIARNSAFDARMMRVVMPGIVKMPWLCTSSGWPWPQLADSKLDTICFQLGIPRPATHDALADCRALANALLRHSGKTARGRTYLAALLAKSPRTHEYDEWNRRRSPSTVPLGHPTPGSSPPPDGFDPTVSVLLWSVLAIAFAIIIWFLSK